MGMNGPYIIIASSNVVNVEMLGVLFYGCPVMSICWTCCSYYDKVPWQGSLVSTRVATDHCIIWQILGHTTHWSPFRTGPLYFMGGGWISCRRAFFIIMFSHSHTLSHTTSVLWSLYQSLENYFLNVCREGNKHSMKEQTKYPIAFEMIFV